ncbi:amino acid adenylation domain-containing protein [Pseudoalteromonas luteoviolacea]|uniref:amino acid adenylation domain-containing protein n=1 Tax=Pseudoalteromonas luteoviolacea TaxID=43657 RepID=UPI001F1E3945|nr:amino acid adenylation domain-containing protein [Pseudoalteromonas luteoviolacea]MCF6437883.1 amino acid adenylation domain-containing protein [Pseudoalteromonas luteoviolacea]
MTLMTLLAELERKSIQLEVSEHGQLKVNGNKSALTPELIQQLRVHKTSLISKVVEESATSSIAHEDGAVFPVSFSQKRFWLMDKLVDSGSQYYVSTDYPLPQKLSMGPAKQALNMLVARHGALRTCFEQQNGQVVQRVMPTTEIPFECFIHSEGEEQALEQRLLMHKESPFDLSTGPLLRLLYIEPKAGQPYLIVTLHHIIADQSTLGILVDEFMQLYVGCISGKQINLPAPTLGYGQYAQQQSTLLQNQEFIRRCDSWVETLSSFPTLHQLPLQKTRPEQQSFAGAIHSFELRGKRLEAVRRLCRDKGLTTFMLLNGIFALLVSKVSNSPQVVFGFPVDTRNNAQLRGVVGPFLNTGLLGFHIEDTTIDAFWSYIRQVNLEALKHQDIPFELIVEKLNPERSRAYSPIFQIMVNVARRSTQDIELIQELHSPIATKHDLTLNISESPNQIVCSLEYCTALFAADHIVQLEQSFGYLIEQMTTQAETKLSQLTLMPYSQLQVCYQHLSKQKGTWIAPNTITAALAEQCTKLGQEVALTTSSARLTYAELDEQSTHLAHHLRALGVTEGDRVGIAVQPSVFMIVAMLGVLKSGAAYVPLSNTLPQARIIDIVSDAEMAGILVEQKHDERLQELQLSLWDLKALLETPLSQAQLPLPETQPDSIAYVIYTSGTTGKPKGVAVAHNAVMNFMSAMLDRLTPSADKQWVLLTPISFDIALFEWFGSILTGNACRIIESQESKDVFALANLLSELEPDLIQATPSRYKQLIAAGWKIPPYCTLLCGGEPLTAELQKTLFCATENVWNCYGPTEATVWSNVTKIVQGDTQADKVRLSQSLGGYSHFVLDDNMACVSPGQEGQLAIAGASLAAGYWGKSSLTDDKFVNLSLLGSNEQRVYLTGDRVRWHHDLSLEFIGRFDDQVKVSGHRIELADVEYNIRKESCINDVAAVVIEGEISNQLIAFIVYAADANEDTQKSESKLRHSLRRKLPDYMVPARFIEVAQFPLNSNGKVDKKQLLKVDFQIGDKREVKRPQSRLEQDIARIWEGVLQRVQCSIDENFFEAGGDSLRLVTLTTKLQEAGYAISINQLMEYQTIEEIACLIDEGDKQQGSPVILKLNDGPIEPVELFVVHPLLGTLNTVQAVARAMKKVCRVTGIQAPFLTNQQVEFDSLGQLAAYYWQEIRRYKPKGPYYFGGVSSGGAIAMHLCELANQSNEQAVLMSFDSWPLGFNSALEVSQAEVVPRVAELVLDQHGYEQLCNDVDTLSLDMQKQRLLTHLRDSSVSQLFKDIDPVYFIDFMVNYLLSEKRALPMSWCGDIIHFSANDNPHKAELSRAWQALNKKSLIEFNVDGNHENFLDEENYDALLEGLKKSVQLYQV